MPAVRMCMLTTSRELLSRRNPGHQVQPWPMQRASSAFAAHCRRRLCVHGMYGSTARACRSASRQSTDRSSSASLAMVLASSTSKKSLWREDRLFSACLRQAARVGSCSSSISSTRANMADSSSTQRPGGGTSPTCRLRSCKNPPGSCVHSSKAKR